MTAARSVGEPALAVLVHGVGIGAGSFDGVAARLEAAGYRVVVPVRRGYGEHRVPARSLDEQVGDLVAVLDGAGVGSATFVGVLGGATLVLALLLAHPGAVTAAVVHEPLLGPLAPELHAALQRAGTDLASHAGPEPALHFMAGLVGDDAWVGLDPAVRADLVGRADVIRAEVPQFLGFAPTAEQLDATRAATVLTTVGERSPQVRHLAARALADHAGAAVRVLTGARHLPQWENPDGFVDAIVSVARPGADLR